MDRRMTKTLKKKVRTLLFLFSVVIGITAVYGLSSQEEYFASAQPVAPDSLQPVAHLDRSGLQKVLSSSKYSMIEFGGRYCKPCKAMQPILARLASQYDSLINICNFFLEDDPPVARTYRVNLIPTQIIFDQNGKEISRHVGLWEESKIVAQYKKLGILK
jgi:thioredoxin 1